MIHYPKTTKTGERTMITKKDLGLNLSLFPKQELLLSHPDMIPDDYEVPGEVLFGGAAGGQSVN